MNAMTDDQVREILCADDVAAWLGVDRKTVYYAAGAEPDSAPAFGEALAVQPRRARVMVGV